MTDSAFVRCPKCGHSWSPGDCDDHWLYSEGEHEVFCDSCDHRFVVVTHVSFAFSSPPLQQSTNGGKPC